MIRDVCVKKEKTVPAWVCDGFWILKANLKLLHFLKDFLITQFRFCTSGQY